MCNHKWVTYIPFLHGQPEECCAFCGDSKPDTSVTDKAFNDLYSDYDWMTAANQSYDNMQTPDLPVGLEEKVEPPSPFSEETLKRLRHLMRGR